MLPLLALLASCGGSSDDPDGTGVSGLKENNPDGLNGAALTQPYTVPQVKLTDTAGEQVEVGQLLAGADKPLTLVFFGYTKCPDICQVVMANIAAAINRLDDAEREQVGMLLVTSDPQRDDPETLRTYLDHFDPSFEGLTGPLDVIEEVAHALGVAIEKGDKLPSGGYAVNHGTQIIGVQPDGTGVVVWTEGTSSQYLAQDLTTILRDGLPQQPDSGGGK
ncbi:MAG: SCO family protein [Nocardioidaceae bacterium]|nr:MAG: SCO family protein [Nocardioidaceae bacterium]